MNVFLAFLLSGTNSAGAPVGVRRCPVFWRPMGHAQASNMSMGWFGNSAFQIGEGLEGTQFSQEHY